MRSATVFAPGSIGNVGPGFDVLGLAIDGIGDEVTVELHQVPGALVPGPGSNADRTRDPGLGTRDLEVEVTGRDADLIPRDAEKNLAWVGANAWLQRSGSRLVPRVKLQKGLPLAGGLGGSSASTVGGIAAAAFALGERADPATILEVALAVESTRHLDNAAAIVYGGLILVRSVDPIDVIQLHAHEKWWLAVVTPRVRVETKSAREILPKQSARTDWVQQMANTAALAHALTTGEEDLLRRALDDRFAEPVRAKLIPRFNEVKQAALKNGALGCSISGAGPTVFAIASGENAANTAANAMREAFGEVANTSHVGRIANEGVRRI